MRAKIIILSLIMSLVVGISYARSKKIKFYDFRDQLIHGEIKRPTTLYTDAREKVKFERLLKLKKSFLHRIYDSGKEKIFK